MILRSLIVGAALAAGLTLAAMATSSVAPDPELRFQANSIRAGGPKAFHEFFEAHRSEIETYREASAASGQRDPSNPALRELIETLDQAAQQRDAAWAGLYWFTDLAEAQVEASRTGRPILSLRLLGRLTDEYSCANSRFFRTAFYANQRVSDFLRDHYVLHWESVRPVPKITIDFGDGRVIEQTITGNSIHYVVAPNGSVIDAIPGLYTPDMFLQRLKEGWAALVADRVEGPQPEALARAEFRRLTEVVQAKAQQVPTAIRLPPAALAMPEEKKAIAAMARAMSKSLGESRMLNASIGPPRPSIDGVALGQFTARYQHGAVLDARSTQLMRAQLGQESAHAFQSILAAFERSMIDDSAWNEYSMRRQILGWLANDPEGLSLTQINDRVYSELFLTPRSDPWLGLLEPSAFSALWGGSVRQAYSRATVADMGQ